MALCGTAVYENFSVHEAEKLKLCPALLLCCPLQARAGGDQTNFYDQSWNDSCVANGDDVRR